VTCAGKGALVFLYRSHCKHKKGLCVDHLYEDGINMAKELMHKYGLDLKVE